MIFFLKKFSLATKKQLQADIQFKACWLSRATNWKKLAKFKIFTLIFDSQLKHEMQIYLIFEEIYFFLEKFPVSNKLSKIITNS